MTETGNDAKKREALSVDELADKVREIAAIIHTDEFHEESHELERLADEIKAAWKRERDELIYAYDPTKAGRGRLPDGSAYALEAMREPVTACHAVGDAAALRQAVIKALTLFQVCTWPSSVSLDGVAEVIHEIDSVLDKPPRQCNMGTPDEQAQRFHDFCAGNSSGINGMCKPTCPCIDCFDKCQCFAKWAQMPYTQGGETNE